MAHLDRSAIGPDQPVVLNVVDHLVDDAPEDGRGQEYEHARNAGGHGRRRKNGERAEDTAEHAVVPRPCGEALPAQPLRFQTSAGDGLID